MQQATPGAPIDARSFRSALGSFATGVTVVTTQAPNGQDFGVTANSFNSVSLDPPMVLWSLAKKAKSVEAFINCEYFAVHVLSLSQDDLSALFARSGVDKFKDLAVDRGLGGIPLLRGCSARFQCRRAFVHEGGDHLIIIGEVRAFDHDKLPPLVFHCGNYALAIEKNARAEAHLDADEEPDTSFSRDFLIYLLGRAHHQLFLSLRVTLDRHGLNEDEWFALSVLGVSDHRPIAQLDHILRYTGKRVTYELIARLAAAGFVSLDGGHDPNTKVALTETGRKTVIELVAAGKSAEAHAERNLGTGETLLLKTALRRIIRDTTPSAPAILRVVDDE